MTTEIFKRIIRPETRAILFLGGLTFALDAFNSSPRLVPFWLPFVMAGVIWALLDVLLFGIKYFVLYRKEKD